jgi:hypothetical protein
MADCRLRKGKSENRASQARERQSMHCKVGMEDALKTLSPVLRECCIRE